MNFLARNVIWSFFAFVCFRSALVRFKEIRDECEETMGEFVTQERCKAIKWSNRILGPEFYLVILLLFCVSDQSWSDSKKSKMRVKKQFCLLRFTKLVQLCLQGECLKTKIITLQRPLIFASSLPQIYKSRIAVPGQVPSWQCDSTLLFFF